jgi:hypothetical protein
MRHRPGLFLLVLLLDPACASEATQGAPGPIQSASSCALPLSACGASQGEDCEASLAYDQALAKHAGCCDLPPGAGGAACGELITATCGSYRVLAIGTLGVGTYVKQYYDDAGRVVGARYWTDTAEYCGQTRFSQAYGLVPSCDETPTVLCHRSGYLRPIAGVE